MDNSPFRSTFTFNESAKKIILPESKKDHILPDKQLVLNTKCAVGAIEPNLLLEPLDEMQKQAVIASPSFPLQLIGDPGTGKSKILGHRAAWLISKYKVPPENIFIFTRTQFAAQQLVTDVTHLLETNQYKGNISLNSGTIHYHCLRYIHLHCNKLNLASNFTVLSPEQQRDLISSVLVSNNIVDIGEREGYYPSYVDYKSNPSRKYQAKARYFNSTLDIPLIDVSFVCEAINYIKSKGITIEEWAQTSAAKKLPFIRAIFNEYEKRLKEQDIVDLNDLVLLGSKLVLDYPETTKNIEHIIVDSFEDLTTAQYQFICLMSQNGGLSVAGDPNQAIYFSQNTQPHNFEHMQYHFPQTQQVGLYINYRSEDTLVKLGQQVIKYDQSRGKLVRPFTEADHIKQDHCIGPATVTFFTFEAEVCAVSAFIKYLTQRYKLKFSDFALLDRYSQTPEVLSLMRNALDNDGIPHTVLGREFWQQSEIVSLLSAFRTIQSDKHEEDTMDSAVWMNLQVPSSEAWRIMKYGIAPTYFEKLEAYIRGEVHSSFLLMSEPAKKKVIKYVELITLWRSIVQFSQRLEPTDPRLEILMGKLFDNIIQNFNATSWGNRAKFVSRHKENVALLRERFLKTMGSLDPSIVARLESGAPDYLATFLRLQAIDYVMEQTDENRLTIGTAYETKGFEWPIVFTMKFGESVLKDANRDYDEALRKFYVSLSSASGSCFLMADFISHRQDFVAQGKRVDPVYPLSSPLFSQSEDTSKMNRMNRFPEQHFAMFPVAERVLETTAFFKRDLSSGLCETSQNQELAVEYLEKIAAIQAIDETGGQIMAKKMSGL